MYINFVELESPMLHTKLQDHMTSASGEDFKGFYYIWAWRSFWLCDLYHLYKLFPQFQWSLFMKFGIDWPRGLRENYV